MAGFEVFAVDCQNRDLGGLKGLLGNGDNPLIRKIIQNHGSDILLNRIAEYISPDSYRERRKKSLILIRQAHYTKAKYIK